MTCCYNLQALLLMTSRVGWLMQQIIKFFWVLGLSVHMVSAYAAPARIEAVKYSGQGTELEFDLDASAHYRCFTLKNPSRLVLDFENTTLTQGLEQPPANHPLAVGVRSAKRNASDLRVVVELNAEAQAKIAAVNKGQGMQLHLDLTPVAAVAAPAVSSKKSAALEPVAPEAKPKSTPVTKVAAKAPVKTAKAKGRDIVIAIDAGHGGKDVGAQGNSGTQEKDVVLAIAKRLESKINQQPGMKAVMIRNGDYFVKLRERVKIAQKANADLFVSIHADAFDDPSAHGASVYTLAQNGASSQMAQFLANSENAADGSAGGNEAYDDTLASVLMDLSNKAAKEASQHVGSKVLKSVKNAGHLHRSSVQKAGFVVLKSPIPSILVETAFISNPEEERRLNARGYQDQMASAVFSGIKAHFKQYAPANTLFAQLQKSGKADVQVASREPSVEPVVSRSEVASSNNFVKVAAPLTSVNAASTQHVISQGETLSGIAQQYGVSMREIRHANGMNDGEVRIGQVLQIPRSI